MPLYFTAPGYFRQGVVAGFVLTAPDWEGTPPGSGAGVSFTFYNSDISVLGQTIKIATGYQHYVTIGADTYAYVQQNGDTVGAIATALANAINGAPEAMATATTAGGTLTLTPRQNTGNAIACSASDGATGKTLFELTGNELVPGITKGVLFAQGTMYRPAVAPVLPAAPASQQSWLFYSSSTGWYWGATSTPTTYDDACVGWVATNASAVIAVSSSKVGGGDEASIVPGGPVVIAIGATGQDSGVPGLPDFAAAETNSQLLLADLTLASAVNAAGIAFATFLLYYVDESAGTTLTLTAGMTSGATSMSASGTLPASTPGSVSFTFYNATHGGVTIGPGYRHNITIGAATYVYVQRTEDAAGDVAAALAALINAEADPNAMASAVGAVVTLTALQNTGSGVTCSASDGNTPATLTETEPSYVAVDQEIIRVGAANGSVVARAQKASAAAAHASGAKIWPVTVQTVVFALPLYSYGTPAWPTVVGQLPFFGKALVAADCWVANEIGPSAIRTRCFTGQGPYAVDSLGNPLAPDVAAFTATVTVNINVGGLPYYQFGGTVTTGPAPANTAEIDVVVTDSSTGATTVVQRLFGPFTANTAYAWKSGLIAQPASGATLTFSAAPVSLNVDLAPTVSAYSVTGLSVPNGTVTVLSSQTPQNARTISGAEIGPRVLKVSDQTTYTTVQVTITESDTPPAGNVFALSYHLQLSADGGATWFDAGDTIYAALHAVNMGGYYQTQISIGGIFCKDTDQTFAARVWTQSKYVDNGPLTALTSSTFTIGKIGMPVATLATISYTAIQAIKDSSSGKLEWRFTVIVKTPGTGDACTFQITRQNCDSSGTPGTDIAGDDSATENGPMDFPNDGGTYRIQFSGPYQPDGGTYTSLNIRVYGFSRTAETTTPVDSWKDPTYSTLQQWAGGATNKIFTYGAMPSGTLRGDRFDSGTLGDGLAPTPVGNRLRVQRGSGLALTGGNALQLDITTGLKFIGSQAAVDTGAGLTNSGNSVVINVASNGGISFSVGQVQINIGTSGLALNSNVLGVNAGNGVQVVGGAVGARVGAGLTTSGANLVASYGNGMTLDGSSRLVPNLNAPLSNSGGPVSLAVSNPLFSSVSLGLNVGNGLAAGTQLIANISTGIKFSGSGSPMAIDFSTGLNNSGNSIVVNYGSGLGTSGLQIVIPAGGVSNAMITDLDVSKLNVGTLTVGAGGMTFSGAGGIALIGGGGVNASPGSASFDSLTLAYAYGIPGTKGLSFGIYRMIDGSGNANFVSYAVGGVAGKTTSFATGDGRTAYYTSGILTGLA